MAVNYFGYVSNFKAVTGARAGLLANRPTANGSQGVYYSLDTNQTFFDFSGAWVLVGSTSSADVGNLQQVTDNGSTTSNAITANSFIKSGGTSSQFLKADGSVDTTSYLPLSGGTLTGLLAGTSANFSQSSTFGGLIPITMDRGGVTGGFVWADYWANGGMIWRTRSQEPTYEFELQSVGAGTVFSLTQSGNLSLNGSLTSAGANFSQTVSIQNGRYLELAGAFTRIVRSGGLAIENNGYTWTFNDAGNFVAPGSITANSFIKSGGTSSQFLKADGSVDTTSYLPLSGGTLTGALTVKNSFEILSNDDVVGYYFSAPVNPGFERNIFFDVNNERIFLGNGNNSEMVGILRNTSTGGLILQSGFAADIVIRNGLSTTYATIRNNGIFLPDLSEFGFGSGSTFLEGDSSINRMYFKTASTERMRIDENGKIQIGTDVPATEQLRVANGILSDTYLKTGAPLGSTAAAWKLGSYETVGGGGGSIVTDAYIAVEIGGVVRNIALVSFPSLN